MKTLIKTMLAIIFAFSGVYISFPAWSGWLISHNLPENIVLKVFESEYPSIHKFTIQHLEFQVDGWEVVIEDMDFDYNLDNVSVEKMSILQQAGKATENDSRISLPVIKTDDLAILEKFTKITINKLSLDFKNNRVRLSNFDFRKLKKGNFEFSFGMPDIVGASTSSPRFIADLHLSQKWINVAITHSGKQLIDATYQLKNGQIEIESAISIENVRPFIPLENYALPFEPKGVAAVVLKQGDSNQDIAVDLNVHGQSQNGFKFESAEGNIESPVITFILNSELTLQQHNAKKIMVAIENARYELSAPEILIVGRDIPLDVRVEDYKIAGSLDNIQADLNHIKNINWKLSGLFSTPKIKGIYLGKFTDDPEQNKDQLKVEGKAEINFELTKNTSLSTQGKLTLSALNISNLTSQFNGNLQIQWQNIQHSLSEGNFSVIVEGQNSHIADFIIENLAFESNIDLTRYNIEGSGKLSINQQLLAPYSFLYDKSTTDLSIKLKKNQLANQLFNHFLQPLGKKSNILLKITGGDAIHSGEILLSRELLVDSNFAVENMSLQFGDNHISGLNIEQKITSFQPLKLDTSLTVDDINFSSGLELKNFKVRLESLTGDSLAINNLSGEILDGKLVANSITMSVSGMVTSIIEMQQISLTELIFFMDISGLYGEGKIDFSLPISIDEEKVLTISEGSFKASEEGIIKYSSSQTASAADENVALKALENFHYKSLDGTVSYNKFGKYHIKLHLLGANPELYDGYPVDFVLNLQGELSGVFRSLFLTGNFQQAVMDKVKASQLDQ